MVSKEILTLQFGHYANFVGTHWWNIQESSFQYDSAAPSEIDHNVLFREGITPAGQVTFTPRLLLVDLKNSLKTLPIQGDLYEEPPDPSQLFMKWEGHKIELQEAPRESKNAFQTDINNASALPTVATKKYNLEQDVQVWSDFLYSRFHPRTVNVIKQYQHCNAETPFDSYSLGAALWKSEVFEDRFSDDIRRYVEECDYFQGFHILTDCTNGFAGLSSACLEHIRDEYDRKSVLVLPTIPAHFPDNDFQTAHEQVYSLMNDSTRVINLLLSFNTYREFSSMFVPLCTSEAGWRQPGLPRQFYHTQYNHKLPYHSSAFLAAALDTISLKYRLESSTFSLSDLCADLTANDRKAAAGSLCMPFSLNADADLIDCLDQWEGPLYKSITPRCSIGTERVMQHLMLRGVPETRLKKPPNKAGKQKAMAAYNCKSVKDMLELFLACSTYATASHVSTISEAMSTKNPFPDLFDDRIGVHGNVSAIPRLEHTRVESVPILAGLHSGSEIGQMFESLHTEAKKLKIARFNQFTLEADEYEDALNSVMTLRENYEDSFLV
ncbi:protein misato [Dendroctonus ponderosae]|uniref:protein misato n=1 Tax=Dendroctonus ponderosae TaxID=77166 RepID=UPI002034AD00|nr:protein misato [Dendroctonus ponderosae]KAH1014571.1 hypothetical protein HUJ05_012424 [Dendroctonus ponderosae]